MNVRDIFAAASPEIYQVQTKAPGPAGRLPINAEMLANEPSGNLFGLTQNAGMGWNPEELGRKQFLILSTQGGLREPTGKPVALGYHTGHWEIGLLVEASARELRRLKTIPFAAYCSDPCDGRTQGTTGMFDSLPYRNDAAQLFRRLIRSLPVRAGVIGIATCDKGLPAMMMALAGMRDLPCVLVPGGVTLPPTNGEDAGMVQTLGARYAHGLVTLEEAADLGCRACGSPGGGCQFLGTAATSQVVGEALGLSLPHTALAPSGQPVWADMAVRSAQAVVDLELAGLTTADILTDASIRNAMVVHAAFGGSTNLLLHIPAIAHAAGLRRPTREDWIDVNRRTPRLVSVLPNGPVHHPTVRVFLAGGVPEVMLHLRALGLLDTTVLTVTGRTLNEVLDAWEKCERRARFKAILKERDGIEAGEVIFSPASARERGLTGTMAFPRGNLAPEGSLIKSTAIDPTVVDADGVYRKEGPARVFTTEKAAIAAIKRNEIQTGDVLVLAGVGPLGTGMEETYQVTSALKHLPFGKNVAVLTDARFSGVSTGACIGHVGPEALAGGPIGKLRDGDVIRIVIDRNRMDGSVDFIGEAGRRFPPEEGATILAKRSARTDLAPHPQLPDDTRLWAALQSVSGGAWGGCVFDVDQITKALDAGKKLLCVLLCMAFGLMASRAAEAPVIPVGLDAYRQWDHWAYQRIGERAYMRSTYDRAGGNEGADASHFLYQLSDSNNVTLDVVGAGVLYFARYNHWHGSPWRYAVDGKDFVVQETSTASPKKPAIGSVFLPTNAFPAPLAVTWDATQGADLSWVPIGFQNTFRMGYERTHYGTGYYIYDQFVEGTKLSQPIKSWSPRQKPDKDVLRLIARAGTDLTPKENIAETNGTIAGLRENATNEFLIASGSPVMVRRLSFTVSTNQALAFGRARLRITWDAREQASIDAPVALFFGAGTLYNRDGREYLVKAFPSYIRYAGTNVELACFFPMPFFRSAKIELIAQSENSVTDIHWSVACQPLKDPPSSVGYFHATYRDFPEPKLGEDLVLLDTRAAEGGGDWSGSFVGNSWIFSDRVNLGTLEGDPRFFFDDSQTPQAQGTGTEEWGGGGDYWGGLNMTLPFAGHPTGARKKETAKNDLDMIESAYRFLLADLMPFGKNAIIRLEHGGTDESTEHYQTVTYWYGAPASSLVKTDELKIGDIASEAEHGYVSPDASVPYEISSRYELGPDHLKGREIYPAQSDVGRKTTGTSEFVLKLNPKNLGVMLRRKLDYQFPNQRAEVSIADAGDPAAKWRPAGIWYLAGGNTCAYSNPKNELGTTQHVVQTSNRRFRDDEFLVPRNLTEGRMAIRVRVRFTAVNVPLYPGHPLPDLAWSEMRYDAYCFVLPDWDVTERPTAKR